MKRCYISTLVAVTGSLVLIPHASDAQSTTDLWDISQGTVITAHSDTIDPNPNYHFDIRDMFGGRFGNVETGNTIFADQQGPGFVHFVEWKTPTAIRLDRFDLYAQGDLGAPYGSDFRDFSEFRLYAKSSTGSAFHLVEDYIPTHPFPHGFSPVTFTLTNPVIGQDFRAEFVQYDKGFFGSGYLAGPRIMELDGFGAAVPEPGAYVLLGSLGLTSAAFLRRKRAC